MPGFLASHQLIFVITLIFIVFKGWFTKMLDKSKDSCALLDLWGKSGLLANVSTWIQEDGCGLPHLSSWWLFQKPSVPRRCPTRSIHFWCGEDYTRRKHSVDYSSSFAPTASLCCSFWISQLGTMAVNNFSSRSFFYLKQKLHTLSHSLKHIKIGSC